MQFFMVLIKVHIQTQMKFNQSIFHLIQKLILKKKKISGSVEHQMKVMDDKAMQAVFDTWNLDVKDAFLIEDNN